MASVVRSFQSYQWLVAPYQGQPYPIVYLRYVKIVQLENRGSIRCCNIINNAPRRVSHRFAQIGCRFGRNGARETFRVPDAVTSTNHFSRTLTVVREWFQHSACCFIFAARAIVRPVADEIFRYANISSIRCFTFETRVSAGTHIRRLVAFVNAMADTVAHPFRISKFQVFQAGAHLRLVRPVQAIVPSIAERASIHAFPIPASKFHPRAIATLHGVLAIFSKSGAIFRFLVLVAPTIRNTVANTIQGDAMANVATETVTRRFNRFSRPVYCFHQVGIYVLDTRHSLGIREIGILVVFEDGCGVPSLSSATEYRSTPICSVSPTFGTRTINEAPLAIRAIF